MITRVSTVNMSREEWLDKRRLTIGGSDAAAILGLSEYSSPYYVWAEKTGKVIPEDISDKEAVRLGNDLEDYVAKRWSEKTGKKVRRDRAFIYNSDYPFAHANIDRSVVGEDAGLEIKTTSSWEIYAELKEGKIPDHWYCQMVHYMMITGAKKWYLGALVFSKGFYDLEVERDDAEILALATAEEAFWHNVTSNTPPSLDGSEATQEALRTILKDSIDSSVDLTGVSNHLFLYAQLKDRIKEMEKELAEHQAYIQSYMGQAEKGTYDKFSVSYKTQTRRNFDREAFEKLNGPINEVFFKTSTSRPFKVTISKK